MEQYRVSSTHELATYPLHNNLPQEIKTILDDWACLSSDYVILGYVEQELIGFFRFDYKKNKRGDRILYATGTWVRELYRNQRVAFQLWELAIKMFRPNLIDVAVTSDAGLKLIQSIKSKHPNIKCGICNNIKILNLLKLS